MAKVEWADAAIEDLERLDKPIAKRILNKISWFSQNFDHITPEPLSKDFSGAYKLRIGHWRVVYTIEPGIVLIQAVGHRSKIYE